MSWGKIPAAEIKERQGRALHQFLAKKIYPYHPFYRKLFDKHGIKPDHIRRLSDLKLLPFTTKQDIVPAAGDPSRYRDFILQPRPEQLRADLTLTDKIALWAKSRVLLRSIQDQLLDEYLPVHTTFTTGRTSLPTPFVYTERDMKLLREAGRRMFSVAGLKRVHDRGLNAMPFAPHLGFWQVVVAAQTAGILTLHSGGGRVIGTEALLKLGERTMPTFLVGTPGYIMHLAQVAGELGVQIPSIKKIILGAERVSDEYKEKLRERFAAISSPGVEIRNVYGFTEAKRAWMETADAPDSRFAMYPDMEIFEVVDPDTGEAVGEGEPGEVVYTQLAGAGSVVLRYRTGDRVKEGLVYDRCSHSGLVLPLLGTSLTRVSEIKKVKGTLVDFNELFAFFSSRQEIVEWQVVLSKPPADEHGRDIVTLRLALSDDASQDAFTAEIQRDFKALTEISLNNVEYFTRAELASMLGMESRPKEARIIDERESANQTGPH